MDSASVTEEQKTLFLPLFIQRMTGFMKLSPESQAKALEIHKKTEEDPAFRAEFMAEIQATFKAANTDGSGLLNKEMFLDYSAKNELNYKARIGEYLESSQEIKGKWYDAVNTITPDVDGASLADIHQMMLIGKTIMAQQMNKKQ